jgi:hypothetical protein
MLPKHVTYALLASAMLAITAAASPALACKGTTVLFKDDFTKPNRAWARYPNWDFSFAANGGRLLGKAPEGKWGWLYYSASFFPDADACVDVIMPRADDAADKWAALGFDNGEDGLYTGTINFDGTIAVQKVTHDGWLAPIPTTESDAVKKGANAVNQIRLVWKAAEPTVSFYVNDKLIDSFDAAPLRGRKIGLGFQTSGATVEFRNLVVTK